MTPILKPVMRDIRDTLAIYSDSGIINQRVIYGDWIDGNGVFHYRSCVEISAYVNSQYMYDSLERLLAEKWIPECQNLTKDTANV